MLHTANNLVPSIQERISLTADSAVVFQTCGEGENNEVALPPRIFTTGVNIVRVRLR